MLCPFLIAGAHFARFALPVDEFYFSPFIYTTQAKRQCEWESGRKRVGATAAKYVMEQHF